MPSPLQLDGQSCFSLPRSSPHCPSSLGFREQRNEITSFVDASSVYGSNAETARELREGEGGRMREGPGGLLPEVGGKFAAGDKRAREMPGLLSMHTLFLREHNRYRCFPHKVIT